MSNKINIFIFIIALFAGIFKSQAQNAAACNAPQTICDNPAFMFTSTACFGLSGSSTLTTSNPSPNPQGVNSGCMYNSNVPNPEWLLINITSTGNLGFVLGP